VEGESFLQKRIISGAILIPIVTALLVFGGWPYRILVMIATLVAAGEYAQMYRKKGSRVSIVWVLLLTLAWQVEILLPEPLEYLPIVTVVLLGMTLRELWLTRRNPELPEPATRWGVTLAGGSYLGIGGAHLIGLRALPDGLWWVLTAFIIVWVSDSAAYFIGRRWGRRKMASSISPGKSWEGYAAQVVSGPLIGVFLTWLWPTVFPAAVGQDLTLTLWHGLLLGGLISVLCPAGDFLISMIKREVGVKDTSNLIPGHGGVLDRIDSILWAGILAHLFARAFVF
jgi:phosphatidate cytidylyltransferase